MKNKTQIIWKTLVFLGFISFFVFTLLWVFYQYPVKMLVTNKFWITETKIEQWKSVQERAGMLSGIPEKAYNVTTHHHQNCTTSGTGNNKTKICTTDTYYRYWIDKWVYVRSLYLSNSYQVSIEYPALDVVPCSDDEIIFGCERIQNHKIAYMYHATDGIKIIKCGIREDLYSQLFPQNTYINIYFGGLFNKVRCNTLQILS